MAMILIVDDDELVRDTLAALVRVSGHTVRCAATGNEALEIISREDVDVVLTDVTMPGVSGLDLCRYVAQHRPDVPVVMVTAHSDVETAIASLRVGAYDFILKPVTSEALRAALERAVHHGGLQRKLAQLRNVAPTETAEVQDILGNSPEMQQVRAMVKRVADSDASVLITGPSGTGKDVIARAIHACSRRADKPFISINCAALPNALLESELFGHARGAFTDAKNQRDGLFKLAEGGTLFLDEIGDLTLGLQPKLLRALQERKVRPLGSKTEEDIDVRLVCATNMDLEAAVAQNRFRSDLYFRINVVHIRLPALHARGDDVLLLADHFLKRIAQQEGKSVRGLSPAAARVLLEYHWPGNVRELQNCIHSAIATTRSDEIAPSDLPERVRAASLSLSLAPDYPTELLPLRDVERRYVSRVLAAVSGNKSTAARILGIDRKTLYRKIVT
jgi:two-component system response regulator HydG